ncbi:uncharacterized protein [Antedon mediterranea]|uniref:uncharacterized protein n=1 Tax=Antedon mediterranea TaxID=105859 RepID=UPI003AF6CF8B
MTHYHPLLKKEKDMISTVHKILPKEIAKSICQTGSRLAHLYGLPKTHKEKLSMRPILSATGTYNYKLAQWLDEKLKPLSQNAYTIDDVFSFAADIRSTVINASDILVSYDVSSLFTNVPLTETIQIIADKAFTNNWFNDNYGLNLDKDDLIVLLNIATKDQLFQFNGNLYEQVDGVAMGSPLGPLMANVFMCHIEERLESTNHMPKYYKRYVDDTLVFMPNLEAANEFLALLNTTHPAIAFTMETAVNNSIPFLGMLITKDLEKLHTRVYRKPTDTGLLLHYNSHVDNKYKRSLIITMLNRAYKLSSTHQLFNDECEILRKIFKRLKYPDELITTTIQNFKPAESNNNTAEDETDLSEIPVRIILPFKDQKSANSVKRQLCQLSHKINKNIVPVFIIMLDIHADTSTNALLNIVDA